MARFQPIRRGLLTLLLALILTLSATYAPVLLDKMGSTALTLPAYACQPTSTGCG